MLFVFRMEGQVPCCPKCGEDLDVIASRVVEGNELAEKNTEGSVRKPASTYKMVHSCPHCHVLLAMTNY